MLNIETDYFLFNIERKKEMSKLKIAGYLRISVDTEQDQDSTSIENQRAIITGFVKDKFNDYELDFYEDRDRSGYTFEQREDYMRLRPHLMNGDYNILIVKDLSRFSRRNSRGLVELEDLRDAGLRIIAIGDGIDYPTRNDWQQIQIKFLINEFPITDASRKVRDVIDNRQKNAKWICAVPYGYYITNSKNMTYTVDETAIPVVQKIFDLYLEGWGYKKICHHLTEQKIPTPRMLDKQRKDETRAENGDPPTKIKASSVWAVATVKEILVNDFYIGTLRQRKYTKATIHGKDKRLDETEHRVFENYHQPIVDVKKFAKVQELLKRRKTTHYRGQKKYDTDYSGFLFCGDCGSPMFSRSTPRLAPQYICGAYHKNGTNKEIGGCTSHQIRVEMLDIMLKKYIERVMGNSKQMIAELEKAVKKEPQSLKKDSSSLEATELELAKAKEELKSNTRRRDRELDRAETRFTAETLEREIERIYENYDAIEDELRDKIDGLENQVKFLIEKRNTRIQINRISKTALDIFREILAKEKLDKGDIALIVEKIKVYDGGNIEIELKADISMLLETGTVSGEILEQSSFVGNAVNFKFDTESISKAVLVQKVQNQKDKAFSINVVRDGDPLEIFTEKDGEVVFKKYSPVGELSPFATQYADVLARACNMTVLICDRDHVIAAAGQSRKDFHDRRVSAGLDEVMDNRRTYVAEGAGILRPVEAVDRTAAVVCPIIAAGDVTGAVCLMYTEGHDAPGEGDVRLAQVAAAFLGKQMEE